MTTGGKLRILLADDHETVREGLRLILDAQPDLQVVATASDGREAVSQPERITPDVVIMDISMPGMNGLAATIQLSEKMPAGDAGPHRHRSLRAAARLAARIVNAPI